MCESRDSTFVVRTYIIALTLTLLILTLTTKSIGVLEATIVVCPLLYMILDIRQRRHAQKWQKARVSRSRGWIPPDAESMK